MSRKNDMELIEAEIVRNAAERLLAGHITDEGEALSLIEELAFGYRERLMPEELIRVVDDTYGRLRGKLGILSGLLDDDSVNEIMVNGPDRIFVERNGRMEAVQEHYASAEELERVIRRIAADVRREISELDPILDARLPDGSRVNAVMKNIALGGPALTVRKFRRRAISLEEMVQSGCISRSCAGRLKLLVRAGYNIFVSGGTSSGKTTFLNALAETIPDDERIVLIEDSAELSMKNVKNMVRMECRNANSLERGRVDMEMLIKSSLRMRPDRLIVGEVRGREVVDMLQALNTGHSGMSTGHGNSVRGILRRLEAMYISGSDIPLPAVQAQIVEGIDIIVHMARTPDGLRRVIEVAELCGTRNQDYVLNSLYKVNDSLELIDTGAELVNDMKIRLRGLRYA